MVVQRTSKGTSDARFVGRCSCDGEVVATVKKCGRTLKGFSSIPAGAVKEGVLSGQLKGVPEGGPYDVILRCSCGCHLTVRDILVGDVWILAGQSNMQGIGFQAEAEKPHRLVRAFYCDDRWAVAKDPIHNLWEAVDAVHHDLWKQRTGGGQRQKDTVFGAGPGVSFGRAMHKVTGVPQGLIPCAHGGTSMDQWSPDLKEKGGSSLYGAMIRRFQKAGGSVAGVFWYQGESDSAAESALRYTEKMSRFVSCLRQDTGHPDLPIVIVQIARVFFDVCVAGWNSVQEQQRLLPAVIPHLATVPAIDLPMNDLIHISAGGHKRLGRRAAQAMCVLRYGRRSGLPPIELETVAIRPNKLLGTADIEVSFRNVSGSLRSNGPAWGFALVREGKQYDRIFRVDIQGNTAVCRTSCSADDLASYCLHYGYGLAPVCTITDEDDRSLPVFGPLPLSQEERRCV